MKLWTVMYPPLIPKEVRILGFRGINPVVLRRGWFPAVRVVFRVRETLAIAWSAVIIILAIWNLADWKPMTVPSWRDIKFLQRFIKEEG